MVRLYIYVVLLFILTCFCVQPSKATHLVGGHMSYEYDGFRVVSNDTLFRYKIKVEIYRDHNTVNPETGAPVGFDQLIRVGVHHNSGNFPLYKSVEIMNPSQSSISPPGETDCDFDPDVDIRRGIYRKTIELPPSTNGYHLTHVRCCRNDQINLQEHMGQTYYAFIPSTDYRNTSPDFTLPPAPYICINNLTTIENDAIESDGDSIAYRISVPYRGGGNFPGGAAPNPPQNLNFPIGTVAYAPGYSPQNPLGQNGSAAIDAYTGRLQLKATQTGFFAVGVEIREYRNGQYLGSIHRDIQVIVIDCPGNDPPVIIGPVDESEADKRSFYIEAGDQLSFDIVSIDNEEDSMFLSRYGSLFGESGNVQAPHAQLDDAISGDTIRSTFFWQTACHHDRLNPYSFTVEIQDDGCPPQTRVENFEIFVYLPEFGDQITGPDSICLDGELHTYRIENMDKGVITQWELTNGQIIEDRDSSIDVIWEESGEQILKLTQKTSFDCKTLILEKVVKVIELPEISAGNDLALCPGDTVVIGSELNSSEFNYLWAPATGIIDRNAPHTLAVFPYWTMENIQIRKYTLTAQNLMCKSTDTLELTINPRPQNEVLEGDTIVCINTENTYQTEYTDGSEYQWGVKGGTILSGQGTEQINVLWKEGGLRKVWYVETNEFNCSGDTIILDVDVKTPNITEIQGSPVVCPNSRRVLYEVADTSGSEFFWNVSGGHIAADSGHSIRVNWGEEGPGLVNVFEITRYGCISDTLDLEINKSYVLETSEIFGEPEICEFTKDEIYFVNNTNGSIYSWTINGGDITAGDGSHKINTNWGTQGTVNLTVVETAWDSVNNTGCAGDPVSKNIIIHPVPVTTSIAGSDSACIGSGLDFSVTGFPNSDYFWTIPDKKDQDTIAGKGRNEIRVNFDSTGVFDVFLLEVTNQGCPGELKSKRIHIIQAPVTPPIEGPHKVCLNQEPQSVLYHSSGSTNSTYLWHSNDFQIEDNDSSSEVNLYFDRNVSGSLMLQKVSGFGCEGDIVNLEIIVDNLYPEINYVTTRLENDAIIDLSWKLENESYAPDFLHIYKRNTVQTNKFLVDSLSNTQTAYTDENVITDRYYNRYDIRALNICNEYVHADAHQTILLEAETTEGELLLEWTAYEGWDQLSHYEVLRRVNNEVEYSMYENVGLKNMHESSPGLDGSYQCYRIAAYSADGEYHSLSNEVCVTFDALIYVPNAFSPNGDGHNDIFKVVGSNVDGFKLRIFSRWGELLFESGDIEKGWDGTYQDKKVPEGNYIYTIEYEGKQGNVSDNGTLILIR